jgi:hypothetical protein
MPMITQERARAHILTRHGLSVPFPAPLDALRGIFAIQTQYASSLPIALAFRVRNLKSTWHSREEHRDVLKSWTLRSTLHAHTAADHAIVIAALRDRMRTRYLEWFKRELGFDDDFIARMEDEICDALRGGALTRVELHNRVSSLKQSPHAGWGLDLKGLAYRGLLKIIVTDGGATRFAFHEAPCTWEKDDAIAELMRRYYYAFGPATLSDFRYWTGLFAADINRAFKIVEPELEQVEVEGMVGKRFLFGGLSESKIPKVALLAKFDPLTLGHFDKSLFLATKDRDRVFRKAGQVEAGILVDGKFVGTWRIARKGKGADVTIEPFRQISKARLPAIERELRKATNSLGLEIRELDIKASR